MKGEPETRFKAKIAKTEGCWTWNANRDKDGYGVFWLTKTLRVRAHRFAWNIANGPIPEGLGVLHKCDNPPCVNPSHLFLGTNQDNQADKTQKGRTLRGVLHNTVVLDEEKVREIRSACATGEKQAAIAERYGVAQTTVSAINTKRNWRHLP